MFGFGSTGLSISVLFVFLVEMTDLFQCCCLFLVEMIDLFQCCLFLVKVTNLFQCCLFLAKMTDLFQCCLFCDSFVSSLLLIPTDTFWAHTRIHHTAVRMCVSLKSMLFLSDFLFLPDTPGIQHTPTAIRSVQYFYLSTFNCCFVGMEKGVSSKFRTCFVLSC